MTDEVRVRFAPSPTGHVHIGNMRVCIYNWLFARNRGGKMLLRIEDTDTQRSTPEAIDALFKALTWLGIDYDEEPVFQSKRLDKYQEIAEILYKEDYAYYSSKGDEEKGKALIFKVTGDASYTDMILGDRSKEAKDIADFVIMKSDNTPVFHLANVVDDIDGGITHILRGNDHVESTYRHVMIYKALGKEPPLYAHFPMIINKEGKPYSKRDGDAYVGDFRNKGYLPEALFNFLALCGWSPGDNREVIPRDEMINLFSLERVRSSPAQFNHKKMEWMNSEYIKMLTDDELLSALRPFAEKADLDLEKFSHEKQLEMMGLFRERLKTTAEFPQKASYFFNNDYTYNDKDVRKFILKEGNRDILEKVDKIIMEADTLHEEVLLEPFKRLMAEKGVNFLKIAQPLRVAVTGGTASPGIFETIAFLGKEETLRRIKRTMDRFFNKG